MDPIEERMHAVVIGANAVKNNSLADVENMLMTLTRATSVKPEAF